MHFPRKNIIVHNSMASGYIGITAAGEYVLSHPVVKNITAISTNMHVHVFVNIKP